MANSLNFLNKPASPSPAKPIGPQPKPASTAAPKAFLDRANPWNVGGGSTPAPKPAAPAPAPKAQTPAKSTAQRAAIPTRGYNYTDGSYTGATPQQRAREVDQATMSGQAAGQRKKAERKAAQEQAMAAGPGPLKVQAREFAQPAPPAPDDGLSAYQRAQGYSPNWQQDAAERMAQRPINPYLAQQQGIAPPIQPPQLWQMAPTAEQGMAMRPAPQRPVRPWQMAPTAEQGMAMQPARPWQMAPTQEQAMRMQPAQPARAPVPVQDNDQPAALPPTAAGSPTPNAPAQPQAAGPFYGYAPPGPLMATSGATLQPGQRYRIDRPQYTNLGMRALMSDQQLATEDARRQRDAAGGLMALQASGMFRPWSSYSPTEKYYLRYGVMPQGDQLPVDTSGAAALAANEAQSDRLYDDYWDRYRNVIRGRRWYGGTRPGQQETMYGTERAAAIARATGDLPPATTPTAPAAAQGKQAQANMALLAKVNPAAVKNGLVTVATTDADITRVGREILSRYRPDLPADSMNLTDIMAILTAYIPPQDRAAQFKEDADWLGAFFLSE